ncbi:hypothetical protein CONCODRAFT_8967 [Conidiobolus coronatus NRRL 28638]|uniref:Uncharacterized protein n=1 Tax=Conidiobolus coronatus (strain ATCC 28846 / CBS 209.66 / NRRL 28638) TaxID=796925 RepID=A0A137P1F9_CONC2|nr:hypothetical protein CONCODRAFT_8967 [Conidiobolus coronatus NRRL 28638]|eukprot:KXN68711.1 hypothetical protein CONCODRAFT_8967 [Conidiobolus coronatus NRRL 28638]
MLDQNQCIDRAVNLNPAYSASISAKANAVNKYCPNLSPSGTNYCLAKHYNITSYNYNKATNCENQCNQTTLNELYVCYMDCYGPLQIKINLDSTVSNLTAIYSYYDNGSGIGSISANLLNSIILATLIILYLL